jgi:predicted Zn-dependent peptidase
MFVMGATVDTLLAGKALTSAKEVMQTLSNTPVNAAEFEQARAQIINQHTQELAKPDGIATAWLDSDTYGLASIAEQARAWSAMTPGDLQRVASRLVKDSAFGSVVVGNSEVLKAQLERSGKVEVMGEIAPNSESKSDSKTKHQIKSPAKPD